MDIKSIGNKRCPESEDEIQIHTPSSWPKVVRDFAEEAIRQRIKDGCPQMISRVVEAPKGKPKKNPASLPLIKERKRVIDAFLTASVEIHEAIQAYKPPKRVSSLETIVKNAIQEAGLGKRGYEVKKKTKSRQEGGKRVSYVNYAIQSHDGTMFWETTEGAKDKSASSHLEELKLVVSYWSRQRKIAGNLPYISNTRVGELERYFRTTPVEDQTQFKMNFLPPAPDLTQYNIIAVNTSAGKDSQAMMDFVVELAKSSDVLDRVIAVHADLGEMEWKGTRELAEEHARHYNLPFYVVSKDRDLLNQIEHQFQDFPGSKARFCTSDQKTSQVAKLYTRFSTRMREQYLGELIDLEVREKINEWSDGNSRDKKKAQKAKGWFDVNEQVHALRMSIVDFSEGEQEYKSSEEIKSLEAEVKAIALKYFNQSNWSSILASARKKIPQMKILSCLGIRAQEGNERARKNPYETIEDIPTRKTDRWFPIFRFTENDVWKRIDESGTRYHDAYDFGMSRLSCAFCVFATADDLLISAQHNPELLDKYVGVEQRLMNRHSEMTLKDQVSRGNSAYSKAIKSGKSEAEAEEAKLAAMKSVPLPQFTPDMTISDIQKRFAKGDRGRKWRRGKRLPIVSADPPPVSNSLQRFSPEVVKSEPAEIDLSCAKDANGKELRLGDKVTVPLIGDYKKKDASQEYEITRIYPDEKTGEIKLKLFSSTASNVKNATIYQKYVLKVEEQEEVTEISEDGVVTSNKKDSEKLKFKLSKSALGYIETMVYGRHILPDGKNDDTSEFWEIFAVRYLQANIDSNRVLTLPRDDKFILQVWQLIVDSMNGDDEDKGFKFGASELKSLNNLTGKLIKAAAKIQKEDEAKETTGVSGEELQAPIDLIQTESVNKENAFQTGSVVFSKDDKERTPYVVIDSKPVEDGSDWDGAVLIFPLRKTKHGFVELAEFPEHFVTVQKVLPTNASRWVFHGSGSRAGMKEFIDYLSGISGDTSYSSQAREFWAENSSRTVFNAKSPDHYFVDSKDSTGESTVKTGDVVISTDDKERQAYVLIDGDPDEEGLFSLFPLSVPYADWEGDILQEKGQFLEVVKSRHDYDSLSFFGDNAKSVLKDFNNLVREVIVLGGNVFIDDDYSYRFTREARLYWKSQAYDLKTMKSKELGSVVDEVDPYEIEPKAEEKLGFAVELGVKGAAGKAKRMLQDLGLEDKFLSEPDFYVKLKNSPYLGLTIERQYGRVLFTHWTTVGSGAFEELAIDTEIEFKIKKAPEGIYFEFDLYRYLGIKGEAVAKGMEGYKLADTMLKNAEAYGFFSLEDVAIYESGGKLLSGEEPAPEKDYVGVEWDHYESGMRSLSEVKRFRVKSKSYVRSKDGSLKQVYLIGEVGREFGDLIVPVTEIETWLDSEQKLAEKFRESIKITEAEDKKRESESAAEEKAQKDKLKRLASSSLMSGKTTLQKSNIVNTLSKVVGLNGTFQERYRHIEDFIDNGWRVVKKEYPTGVLRRLESPDGSFFEQKTLTKTAMDYAESISAEDTESTKAQTESDKRRIIEKSLMVLGEAERGQYKARIEGDPDRFPKRPYEVIITGGGAEARYSKTRHSTLREAAREGSWALSDVSYKRDRMVPSTLRDKPEVKSPEKREISPEWSQIALLVHNMTKHGLHLERNDVSVGESFAMVSDDGRFRLEFSPVDIESSGLLYSQGEAYPGLYPVGPLKSQVMAHTWARLLEHTTASGHLRVEYWDLGDSPYVQEEGYYLVIDRKGTKPLLLVNEEKLRRFQFMLVEKLITESTPHKDSATGQDHELRFHRTSSDENFVEYTTTEYQYRVRVDFKTKNPKGYSPDYDSDESWFCGPVKNPRKIPEEYLRGLSPKKRKEMIHEIEKFRDCPDDYSPAYEQWTGDVDEDGVPHETKESEHTENFRKTYGKKNPSKSGKEGFVKNVSDDTGVSEEILDKVYSKGLAAWKTGHKPGVTPHQWARARVYSFVTCGKTTEPGKSDHQLAVKAGFYDENGNCLLIKQR